VLNDLGLFHLVEDVIERLHQLSSARALLTSDNPYVTGSSRTISTSVATARTCRRCETGRGPRARLWIASLPVPPTPRPTMP